ncbi:MAG: formate dehydrogenase accessory sulfurtransferase FdhD [Actinomycetota bacterium]|nr:formate dehydrogenase accessory sulfurtransferase FdhD [Actinomycetota bacterium]
MALDLERPGGRPTERARVLRVRDGRRQELPDDLAAEEPLEIRLGGQAVAVTMRTPGHDTELAAGFLVTEGIVHAADVAGVRECRSEEGDGGVADVVLRAGAVPSGGWQRNFYATSSCGVCGKASIEAVRVAAGSVGDGPMVASGVLDSLPDRLREAQRVFDRTGGLHAAGLFRADGELALLREDVGRHNAVDKVAGRSALDGSLPLRDHILLVSGRASFEIMQKALMAGIPVVAAVSAPSSLAVRMARESNMTLVGFLRQGSFNVYAGAGRLEGTGSV